MNSPASSVGCRNLVVTSRTARGLFFCRVPGPAELSSHARSFTDDDLIASDLVYARVRGETSRMECKPDHRSYYFSEMQADETLLIRIHDSADDGRARLSFHTWFENPLAPGAPLRESIVSSPLVFFPPAS